MDIELWIFVTAACLFSCCLGSACTYYAVNWSRDRQEEADQQRRENAIEHGLKLAQDVQQLEQRISGDTPTVELFDGEAERCEVVPETGSVLHRYACDFGPDCPAPGGHVDPLAFAASVGREHAAIQPPAMTGARDVDAQDRELTDIYDIEPDGYCPVEGHHTTVGRRDHGDWLTWCTCGWERESTNQAEANQLYAEHQQAVSPSEPLTEEEWRGFADFLGIADAVASPVDDDPDCNPVVVWANGWTVSCTCGHQDDCYDTGQAAHEAMSRHLDARQGVRD